MRMHGGSEVLTAVITKSYNLLKGQTFHLYVLTQPVSVLFYTHSLLCLLVSWTAYSSTLKMEGIRSSRTLADFHQNTHSIASQKLELFHECMKLIFLIVHIPSQFPLIMCGVHITATNYHILSPLLSSEKVKHTFCG
jgi:hypothetical protein